MNWLKRLFAPSGDINNKVREAIPKTMQRLDVKDGDIVLISIPFRLPKQTWVNLRRALEDEIRGCGFDVGVFLLDEGMEVAGVLSKACNRRVERTENGDFKLETI